MALVEINWNPTAASCAGSASSLSVPSALSAPGSSSGGACSASIYARRSRLRSRSRCRRSRCLRAAGRRRPTGAAAAHLALTAIGLPIGWVVSHVLMAIAFYGVITPIGLLLRLAGRDLLEQRLDREAKSYWQPRRPVTDRRRYFRQF